MSFNLAFVKYQTWTNKWKQLTEKCLKNANTSNTHTSCSWKYLSSNELSERACNLKGALDWDVWWIVRHEAKTICGVNKNTYKYNSVSYKIDLIWLKSTGYRRLESLSTILILCLASGNKLHQSPQLPYRNILWKSAVMAFNQWNN